MEAQAISARFAPIPDALEELRAGGMVVVCDPEREDAGGSLVLVAELATADTVGFMTREGSGPVHLALTPERCAELGLETLAPRGVVGGASFAVPVDARGGDLSPRSADGRALTMRTVAAPDSGPSDLVHGGSVLPACTRPGGVLEHPGAVEAAVDLARAAGLVPVAAVCAIDNPDGTVPTVRDLFDLAAGHDLSVVAIGDLVAHRRRHDPLVERVVATELPTAHGAFMAVGYRDLEHGGHHVALVKGDLVGEQDVLVSVHAECLFGHAFNSLACDCRAELHGALAAVEAAGRGVVLYLPRERQSQPDLGTGRGDRLAAHILADLGVSGVRLRAGDGAADALREAGLTVAREPSGPGDAQSGRSVSSMR